MFQNENFFSNFEPFCGARLWLGGNNEVEKIRRNLHFAHHTVAVMLRDFLFFIEMMIFSTVSSFFYIMHFPLTNCFSVSSLLRYRIVDQKWNYSKNCLRSKANWNVFLNTYVTRKERLSRGSPKGLSEEEGMTWPTLLRSLRNREMAYNLFTRSKKKKEANRHNTKMIQKIRFFAQWDF